MKRRYEFWVRMLFSCLVDADFLDTEQHFNPGAPGQGGSRSSVAALKGRFDRHMAEKQARAEATAVNAVRRRVLEDTRAAAANPQGVFTLTAPTGCGKTLAGMGFALEHALRHGLERVIVVIPYTSIIDQNAKVYREVFGEDDVIDHHASLDPAKETARNRVACENWDAPVVVTTSVQFVESLVANRPSRCRKLHNIARSVVLFDEVQTLPVAHLVPIVDLLRELVAHYGVSLVLSTATQPALRSRPRELSGTFPGFERVTEVVSDVPGTFAALRRVDVHFPTDLHTPTSWEGLAKELGAEKRVLAIVHRRDDARGLAGLVPGAVHLSALMCPAHRLAVIGRIKERLRDPEAEVRVVSTQLVEAGVDLDFPVVYRALGGFDAMAQAAGRCNREGKLQGRGEVRIFVAPTEPPRGTSRDARNVSLTLLAGQPGIDPLDPAVYDRYFRELYYRQRPDPAGIQAKRAGWLFETVASEFQMIEDDGSVPVVVPHGDAPRRLADLGLWEADVCFTVKGYDAATGCYARASTSVLRPRSWYEREELLPDGQAKKVAADAYQLIFQRLDAEPGLGGEEAGRVATAVERLVTLMLAEPGGEVYRLTRSRVLAGNAVVGFAHAADEGAARSQLENLRRHLEEGPDLLVLEPEGSFELAASGLGDASRDTYGLPPRRTR